MDTSLKEQIKQAKSESAIDALLVLGKSYEFASTKTQRAWDKVARNRRLELNSKPTKPVSEDKQSETKRRPRSDKGKSRKHEKVEA